MNESLEFQNFKNLNFKNLNDQKNKVLEYWNELLKFKDLESSVIKTALCFTFLFNLHKFNSCMGKIDYNNPKYEKLRRLIEDFFSNKNYDVDNFRNYWYTEKLWNWNFLNELISEIKETEFS